MATDRDGPVFDALRSRLRPYAWAMERASAFPIIESMESNPTSPLAMTFDEMVATMGTENAFKAITNVGVHVSATAAQLGPGLNGADPALINAALQTLSFSERMSLAHGGSSTALSKIQAVVDQAQVSMQTRLAANAHGPASSDAVLDGAGMRKGGPGIADLLRTGMFNGVDEARSRTVSYAEAGMREAFVPGNADMRGITMANYYTSPITRGVVGAGMNYGTFDYLRDQGFNRTNIVNAARDARALGFSPNDKAAVRDHAIIDKLDPKARETNSTLKTYQDRLKEDEKLLGLIEQRNAATDPDARKALDKQILDLAAGHAKESGLQGRIEDPANLPEVRDAIERRKKAIDARIIGSTELRKELGHERADEASLERDEGRLSLPDRKGPEGEPAKTAAEYRGYAQEQAASEQDQLLGPNSPGPEASAERRTAETPPEPAPKAASPEKEAPKQVASAPPPKDQKPAPKIEAKAPTAAA